MTRPIKRGGKVWINIFPDKPVTKKPAETRMGSGKGNPGALGRRGQAGPHPVRALVPERRAGAGAPCSKAIQKLPIKARRQLP